ncbi:hypothetical protein QN277_022391 [Acacia crassicarpa]|uniref:3-dehydroquinate synthase n=1 Tax=Acacia crassicarpa TaxID=499986 RepID=A0AAE1JJ26_9FABA|nr:hypothetical protein QN277_022391 [Acacia crassicarpa]
MASTANHLSPPLPPKQTPEANTTSSHLHCFQSSKFISPKSSIELNRKCVSASSPGQGRSLRAFADSSRVMDQFTPKVKHGVPTIVEVDLGNWSYPIYIGSGLLDKPELLQRHVREKRVLVVTNNTIAPLYLDKVADALTRGNSNISVDDIVLPDGEQYKDMDTFMRVTAKAPSY